MKKHRGMRPHDIPILLRMAISEEPSLKYVELARELRISGSEISESLNRSKIAGLVNSSKTKVHRQNLVEFIEHGFKYVFPAEKGPITLGVPTSSGHEFMKKHFQVSESYVWPDLHGMVRGSSVEPLFKNQVQAAAQDPRLYKLLALIDVLRLEKLREVEVALKEIKRELL